MSYAYDNSVIAASASADARATFIRRTYAHLAGAVLAFTVLLALLVNIPGIETVVQGMFGRGLWIAIILAFMVVGWVARAWARSETSIGMQYLGLGLYVVVEAVIFLPLIYVAAFYFAKTDPYLIPRAGILTLGVFGGLTAAVLTTKKDFSFLGPIISIGCFIALALALAGMLFGFNLGLFYCFAMVALASAAILYQTSAVVHDYRTDQYVAASLELFAAVALLFWYVLRIAMEASANRN